MTIDQRSSFLRKLALATTPCPACGCPACTEEEVARRSLAEVPRMRASREWGGGTCTGPPRDAALARAEQSSRCSALGATSGAVSGWVGRRGCNTSAEMMNMEEIMASDHCGAAARTILFFSSLQPLRDRHPACTRGVREPVAKWRSVLSAKPM